MFAPPCRPLNVLRHLWFVTFLSLALPAISMAQGAPSHVDILCEFDRGDRNPQFYPFVRLSFETQDRKSILLADEAGDYEIFADGYLSGTFRQGPNQDANAISGDALISPGDDGYLRVIVFRNDMPGFVIDIEPTAARILDFGAFPGMGKGTCNLQS